MSTATGVTVRIDDRTAFEPDACIRCGPSAPKGDKELPDPVTGVEVATPGTLGLYTGTRFEGYFSQPSVRHCLIVQPEKRFVIHRRRDDDGQIFSTIRRDGTVTLEPPGLSAEIAAFFERP